MGETYARVMQRTSLKGLRRARAKRINLRIWRHGVKYWCLLTQLGLPQVIECLCLLANRAARLINHTVLPSCFHVFSKVPTCNYAGTVQASPETRLITYIGSTKLVSLVCSFRYTLPPTSSSFGNSAAPESDAPLAPSLLSHIAKPPALWTYQVCSVSDPPRP